MKDGVELSEGRYMDSIEIKKEFKLGHLKTKPKITYQNLERSDVHWVFVNVAVSNIKRAFAL